MKYALYFAIAAFLCPTCRAQDRDAKVAELDKKLTAAREAASELQKTIEGLATELAALHQTDKPSSPSSFGPAAAARTSPPKEAVSFKEQILRPDLGADERESELSGRPELFIQSRFQTLPMAGTDISSAPSNFVLTRMESRWAGKLSDKVGMGFELQYHPAPMGAAVEIVNDAFVEYYASEQVTVRAGQFVKPFGFDIQQSSSIREAPERGMFAGYFFPGQRDRGLMIAAKLDELGGAWKGTEIYAGVFNGNRFFVDNNRQLNYNFRVRKQFSGIPLAVGLSAQLGRQILPEGVQGTTRENLYGADLQWAWRRLGLRAELVAGNMPSTLVSLEPEFTPLFRPGAHSAGGALFAGYKLTSNSQAYIRYDQFNGDPVRGRNIRATNVGYFHRVGEHSRMGVDYQFKNRPSGNDDLVNTRFQIIWNVIY
jgi:hypothetical protein